MSDTDTLHTTDNGTGGSAALSKCPRCENTLRPGELQCPVCGYMIPTPAGDASTRSLPHATESFEARRHAPIGNIPRHFQRVTFVINGRALVLPASTQLIVGRSDPASSARDPDVDLSPYNANEMGVSRQHIELTWKNDLIYVVDMNSTNGTLLNGQRLLKWIPRLLRDGDQLVIGHLPVGVRFVDG